MYTENVNKEWKFIVSKREREELLLQIIADSTRDFMNQNEWFNTAEQQTVQGINEWTFFFFLEIIDVLKSILKVNKATQAEAPSVRNLSNISFIQSLKIT